jgi:DHA1 family inner membrane transport protein
MRSPILALALGAFAVGTTEFVVIGLLPTIGADLDVDVATGGLLVTGYALGIAIGGPILTWLTRRFAKPRVLVGLMAGFAVAHLVLAVAPTFGFLLVGRLLTASAHGAFFAVGSVVAADSAKPGHEGRAIGLMFTGLTVATVLGVPLGTFVGQQTSWRIPFLIVAGLAAAAAVAIHLTLSRSEPRPAAGRHAPVDHSALALALVTTVVGFGSQFVVFTFLASFLETETRIDAAAISPLLVVYGLASVVGSTLGGKASDRWPRAMLPVALTSLAVILIGFGALGGSTAAAVVLLFAWGVAGFALSPALQARVVRAAGPDNTLASSLNISAFNVGIASGSVIGTAVVAANALAFTPVIAAGLAAVAVIPALIGSAEMSVPRKPVAVVVPIDAA